VTYEQNPLAHIRVEFGFDVLQVSRGRYAPQSYHNFIGFQVAKGVLQRALHDTYSLELNDLLADLDLALGTYRHTVGSVIPEMTKVAWNLKQEDLMNSSPGITRRAFVYNLSKASYRKEWPVRYEKPGIGARILAIIIEILPKVGPLKALSIKLPTPQTEKLFESSFDKTLNEYRGLLREEGQQRLRLANLDLDTGAPTKPGEYWMADDAYSKLAIQLAEVPRQGAVGMVIPAQRRRDLAAQDEAAASSAARRAFERTSAMLARRLRPLVNSTRRARMYGVTLLPAMPRAAASATAV